MLDDGVALVAVVHADAEEAVVLPRCHAAEAVVLEVAMRLRALHHGHFRVVEIARERGQPIGAYLVVGVDHRHHVGTRVGFLQAEVQRAGLEARPWLQVEEAEALAELLAVFLHWLPDRRVLGVVVDHQHFVVLVIQRGQRIERDDHHLRRLVVASQVDGDERLFLDRVGLQHAGVADPFTPPQHLSELEPVDQQDRQDRHLCREQQHQHAPVDPVQVEIERQRDRPHDQTAGQLDQEVEEQPSHRLEAAEANAEPNHRYQRQQAGGQRFPRPADVFRYRAGEGKFGLTVGIENAPVGAGAALAQTFLPGLVECFEQVVIDVVRFGPDKPFTVEDGLVRNRWVGAFTAVAIRWPANLANNNMLVRKALVHHQVGVFRHPHRAGISALAIFFKRYRLTVPEREHVDGDEIDVIGQLRILQPDVFRFRDGHGLADMRASLVEVADHLVDGEVVAKQHFVSDEHPFNGVRVAARQGDKRVQLSFVIVQAGVDIGSRHDLEPLFLGHTVNLRVLQRGVRADTPGVLAQELQIAVDLIVSGKILLEGVLVALK